MYKLKIEEDYTFLKGDRCNHNLTNLIKHIKEYNDETSECNFNVTQEYMENAILHFETDQPDILNYVYDYAKEQGFNIYGSKTTDLRYPEEAYEKH